MAKEILVAFMTLTMFWGCAMFSRSPGKNGTAAETAVTIALPAPQLEGRMSLEQALSRRRSVREFAKQPLNDREVSQLLWAAQGLTDSEGRRTAPSAGGLYPLEVFVATGEGFFHYEPRGHGLKRLSERDTRPAIHQAALAQDPILAAPAVFVLTAVFERTSRKYGPARTPRYVHMEAGHAAQNLLLEAVALGLGAVPIGAFDDSALHRALSLPADHLPLYLIPVGHPR